MELRLLGHYLWPYDDGLFAERVSTPGLDIHAEHAAITGLSRADTKTVTYAFLYGAGPLKIGIGVGVEPDEVDDLADSSEAKSYVGFMKRIMRSRFVMPDRLSLAQIVRGKEVQKRFLEGITGLRDFKKETTDNATRAGYVKAIDGRKLMVRKAHAAVNQLLQGGGSVVCKLWMVDLHRMLQEEYGLIPDRDFGQMAWVHDELQFEHREGLQDVIGEAAEQAIKNAANKLGFRGDLSTDYKTGHNWAECH